MTKAVAGAALGYYGWYLMVKTDRKISQVAELEGKKVGITSAGSGSDMLALWTMQNRKMKFTRVPLGGGGLVPNLLSGNVDAVGALLAAVLQGDAGEAGARSLIDYGAEVPPHLSGLLDRDRQVHRREAAGAAEGAERALRRRRVPAGHETAPRPSS